MSVLECVGPVLAIQCKGKEAHLYLRDLASAVEKAQKGANGKNLVVDPCVAYEDQWVTPNRFVNVICGLKEARPSWKNAVYHSGVTMKKLLDDGTVTLKPLRCRCTECHKSSKSISSPSPKRKNNNNTKIGKKKAQRDNNESDWDSDSSQDTEVLDSEEEQGVKAIPRKAAATKTPSSKTKPPARKVAKPTAKTVMAKKLRAQALRKVARHPTGKVASKKRRLPDDTSDQESEGGSEEDVISKKRKLLKGKSKRRKTSSKVSGDQGRSDDEMCGRQDETEDGNPDAACHEAIMPLAVPLASRMAKSAGTPIRTHTPRCTVLHLTPQAAAGDAGLVNRDTSRPTQSTEVDKQLAKLMETHEKLARKINSVKTENRETLTKLSDCVANVATSNTDILASFVKTVETANTENKEALAQLAQSLATTYTIQSERNKELLDKVVDMQRSMGKTQEAMSTAITMALSNQTILAQELLRRSQTVDPAVQEPSPPGAGVKAGRR